MNSRLAIEYTLSAFFASMFSVFMNVSWADEGSLAAKQVDGHGPRLQTECTEVHLGEALFNRPLSHEFRFRNAGDQALEVQLKKKSCGCVSTLSAGDIIQPGAEGQFTIEYAPSDPPKRHGENSFTIVLGTNDPAKPEASFTLKARLVRPVEISPAVVDFGDVTGGETGVAELTVTCYKADVTPEICSITTTSSLLEVEKQSVQESATTIMSVYKVVLKSGEASGELRENIEFGTSLKELPLIEVPVRYNVPHLVTAKPPRVLFGIVEPFSHNVKDVVLTGFPAGKSPSTAKCPDPRITAEIARGESDATFSVRITLSCGTQTTEIEKIKTQVTVLAEDGESLTKIPVQAVVAGARNALPGQPERQ